MDYDQDGRLQKVYQASGSPTTTYTYNATTGRLSSIADPAQSTLGIGGLLPPASWVSSLSAITRGEKRGRPSPATRRGDLGLELGDAPTHSG
jgi:YD repeat-containing protein